MIEGSYDKLRRRYTGFQMKEITENDKDITVFVEEKQKKVKEGQSIFDIPFEATSNILPLIIYAISKPNKTRSDVIFISYYLSSMPTLVKLLNPKKSFISQSDLLYQLSYAFKLEQHNQDSLICRINDPGDSFYLILSGSVSIILPKEIIVKMSYSNYVKHLKHLITLKEYLLAREIIYLNETNYDCYDLLDYIDLVKSKDKSSINHITISVEDYIQRTIPIIDPLQSHPNTNTNDDSNLCNVTIKAYYVICTLSDGQTFGDIALSDRNQRRTATIISNCQCSFATLNQTAYDITVKDYQNKLRKNNIGAVLSNPLFEGIRTDRFIKKYFNYFKEVTLDQGTSIFTQGDQVKELFFLKEGEVKITSQLSMMDLANVIKEKQEAHNIPSCKGDKKAYDEIKHEAATNILFNKTFVNRILFIKERDVIGLDEFMLGKAYFCTAVCFSKKCSFFCVDYAMFLNMKNDDIILSENIPIYLKARNEMICDRLIKLRNQAMRQRIENDVFQCQSQKLLELFCSPRKVNSENIVKSRKLIHFKPWNKNRMRLSMGGKIKRKKTNDELVKASSLQLKSEEDDRIPLKNKVITSYHNHAISTFDLPLKKIKMSSTNEDDGTMSSSYGLCYLNTWHKTNENIKEKSREKSISKTKDISQSTTSRIGCPVISSSRNNNNTNGSSQSLIDNSTKYIHHHKPHSHLKNCILSISTPSVLKKHPHLTTSLLLLNQYHNLTQFRFHTNINTNNSRSLSSNPNPTPTQISINPTHKPTNSVIDFLAMDRLYEEIHPKQINHYHPKSTILPLSIQCTQRIKVFKNNHSKKHHDSKSKCPNKHH